MKIASFFFGQLFYAMQICSKKLYTYTDCIMNFCMICILLGLGDHSPSIYIQQTYIFDIINPRYITHMSVRQKMDKKINWRKFLLILLQDKYRLLKRAKDGLNQISCFHTLLSSVLHMPRGQSSSYSYIWRLYSMMPKCYFHKVCMQVKWKCADLKICVKTFSTCEQIQGRPLATYDLACVQAT